MQEYEVKRGHAKKTDMKSIFELSFGTYKEEEGWLVGAYGTMPMVRARYTPKGDKLQVDTKNDLTIAQRIAKGDQEAFKMAQDTQRRWNDFLEACTAYDAKTRGKRVQAAAKKGEATVPEAA